MTSHIWHALLQSKHMLSLYLFIILNGLSAIATLFFPFYSQQYISLPIALIFVSSIILLVLTLFYPNRLININIAALFYGLLWASQLIIKNTALTEYQYPVLLMSLLSVLLIATLSFINNISAFILYSLPVYLTVFWLDNNEYGLWLAFTIVLPLFGITIQNQIQKRHAAFTQRMMNKFREERTRLSDLSMLDPLTSLYNRRGFQHRFNSIMAQGDGHHYILLLDIDSFKSYNDHYGHSMGDQTLVRVSAAIRDAVHAKDIVARYGGEEFLVMLTDIQSSQALQAAERIRQSVYDLNITHQFNNSELTDNLTISLGITPLQGDNLEQALLLADKALYKAKNHGRNKILPTEMFDLH